MADLDFSGRNVLVTGASRGIGRETARMFAEHGARVAVHYNHSADAAQAVLDVLPGDGHMLVQCDVIDALAVEASVNAVVNQLGRLDILVNNAGVYYDHPPAEADYETWRRSWGEIIGANLIGAANMSYCAAQHMIAAGGGRIVNVSSRGAFRGEPTAPAYGASKAGMNSMGQSLAKALAPHNIHVMTVAPGWVETDMAQHELDVEGGAAIKSQSPLNRIARPEEIAYTVLFLASEGAEFLTGAVVDANGASYLRT